MLINEFYANREIFITGGTGYLGKALIEKFLRDCPNIKVIYVMLREKKSLNIEQRLEQLKKDKIFDRIRQQDSEVFNKIHAIQGNSGLLGCGICQTDLHLLQNVSIIFHLAANVRFDEPLRSSILFNSRGTHELLKIASSLKNLIAFMHCSTAFCNPREDVVEERVYKIPVNWRKTIQIAETCDEDIINALFYKYSGNYPNSYTFTKNLSEQIIQEYSNKIPICIFRPSVVMNAQKEPFVGWIDNLNGPIAILAGVCFGISPTAYGLVDGILDSIPVDVVIRLTIVAAYKRALQHLRKEPLDNGLEVINCVSGGIFDITFGRVMFLYTNAARTNPMENVIWRYDDPKITASYYNMLLKVLLMGVPLAVITDTILRLKGQRPIMLTTLRRFVLATKAIMYFNVKHFKMINKKMINLENCIPQSELAMYGVKQHISEMDFEEYFANVLRGIKYYIFNQPLEATAAAKKRSKILFIINRSIKLITITLFLLCIWSVVSKLYMCN